VGGHPTRSGVNIALALGHSPNMGFKRGQRKKIADLLYFVSSPSRPIEQEEEQQEQEAEAEAA